MFHLQPQNLPVEREEGGGRNCTLGLIFHFTYLVKFHSIEYLKTYFLKMKRGRERESRKYQIFVILLLFIN